MKLTIPKENSDIQKAIRTKLIRQIVFCAGWITVESVFMITYAYKYFANAISSKAAILIWIAACLVPFYLCKCWRWFTDQSYEGTVIACKQTSAVTLKHVISKGHIRLYTQNIQIRQLDGKTKSIKITWREDEHAPYYYEGDHIRYYRGTKYPQVISAEDGAHRYCVMCGTSNHPEETTCMICGKSLIDHTK